MHCVSVGASWDHVCSHSFDLEDHGLETLHKVPYGLRSPYPDVENNGNALLPLDRAHILSDELFKQASERGYRVGRLMSAQNTHHILTFDHIFDSFYLVISVFIALYLILGFSCISGEKGGIWKLCGDLKKKIGGELSLNVATLGHCKVEVV